jgi:hypothetical protein
MTMSPTSRPGPRRSRCCSGWPCAFRPEGLDRAC